MSGVSLTKLFRDQYFDRLAAQFLTAVPKPLLRLCVHPDDASLLVRNQNGFRNGLEQRPKSSRLCRIGWCVGLCVPVLGPINVRGAQ